MEFSKTKLATNYRNVLSRMESAALASGRSAAEVRLVAVTKYVDAEVIRELFELGCRDFGESRPQILWKKAEELSDLPIRWHMIGHLQTNKVRRTLPHISLLHSGDSLNLLQCMDQEAQQAGKVVDVLCEVNVSGDQSKHGFAADQLMDMVESLCRLDHLRFRGLMAMASLDGGIEQARRDFEKMHTLREAVRQLSLDAFPVDELSMGMSGDFEEAIAWGATLVRIGSTLFEGI